MTYRERVEALPTRVDIADISLRKAVEIATEADATEARLRAELAQAREREAFYLAATRDAQDYAGEYAEQLMATRAALAERDAQLAKYEADDVRYLATLAERDALIEQASDALAIALLVADQCQYNQDDETVPQDIKDWAVETMNAAQDKIGEDELLAPRVHGFLRHLIALATYHQQRKEGGK